MAAAQLPIQVNALDVKKSDDRFIVTLGAANRPTEKWVLGMEMARLLAARIKQSLGPEEPSLG